VPDLTGPDEVLSAILTACIKSLGEIKALIEKERKIQ